jgi:uncharacterized protein (TIGR04255 family)
MLRPLDADHSQVARKDIRIRKGGDMMTQRVRFERPPVVEVVCGVQFGALGSFRAAHVGVFWEQIRTEFPAVDEAPPLSSVIEAQNLQPSMEIAIGLIPPLPRTWFLSEDGHRLIQLQRDRFIYNWRRSSPDDGDYPSYDNVIVEFERLWGAFEKFVAKEKLGELVARQLELAYINVIPFDRIPDDDPVFLDHARSSSPDRFLPAPESFEWREVASGAPIRRLEMMARGAQSGDVRSWFDLAHEWIVRGFTDVTTTRMQTDVWRRIS